MSEGLAGCEHGRLANALASRYSTVHSPFFPPHFFSSLNVVRNKGSGKLVASLNRVRPNAVPGRWVGIVLIVVLEHWSISSTFAKGREQG